MLFRTIWLPLVWLAAALAVTPASGQSQVAFAHSGTNRIAYEVRGAGDPLVLIPGFSQSRQAWDQAGFVDAFVKRGYQVVVIDPLGHGDSTKPHDPQSYRPEKLAADVVAVLDAAGIEQAHLMGYSRGAWIALVTAALHPDRVRSVIAGGAHPYEEDMTPFRSAVADGLDRWVGLIESRAGSLPAEARRMFLSNDVEALRAAVSSDRRDISASLAKSPVPVLLYAGSEDPRAPLARRFADGDPRTDYVELPGLNHFQAFFAIEAIVETIDRKIRAPAR